MTYRQLLQRMQLLDATGTDFTLHAHVHTDSRQIQPGDVFVALPGESNDGHQFLGAASRQGAAVAVVSQEPQQIVQNGWASFQELDSMQLLHVTDTQKALGMMAKAHLEWLRLQAKKGSGKLRRVVGITGSAGKTTTKDLVAALATTLGKTVAPQKSFNNEVGLPLTVLQADTQTEYLVLEMGASQRGDLQYLTTIAPLDIACVLMVGTAHLGGYSGVAQLAQTKAEIVQNLPPQAVAVLNFDDRRVRAMAEQTRARVLFFSRPSTVPALSDGSDNDATTAVLSPNEVPVQATNVTLDALSRAGFDLRIGTQKMPVQLQIIGSHHVHNALAAAAIGHELGMSAHEISQVLSQTGPRSAHRMNLITLAEQIEILDDAYNANPDSMRAALAVLGAQNAKRRTVAVLGQMLELGPAEKDLHTQVGRAVGEQQIPVLVAVGELAREMLDAYQQAYPEGQGHYAATATDARQLIQEIAQKGDLILLKASNGCGLWRIGSEFEEKGKLR